MSAPNTIPAAPALPDNAPFVYELYDWKDPTNPVKTSTVTLDVRGPDFVHEDAVYAAERGAAAWHRSDKVLTLGEFVFGCHLFVSGAQNTSSGSQPLLESFVKIDKRSATWPSYPFSNTYNKKTESVFPGPHKIVAKDKNGNVVHTFEMHDGLPLNDPSLWQKYPTETQPLRPKVCAGMVLPWWNEPPRQSASLAQMFAGITDDGMRPSQTKSHFSVLSCEPPITGGYNRNSLNSLADIWRSKEWPMPKAAYWPDQATADPYANYTDCAYEGHSAFMGPYIEGYRYEPGSYTGHNKYTAPGGPRFDRAAFHSVFALWMTQPNGKRLDGGVAFSTMAYEAALAYGNFPDYWSPNPATAALWSSDADLIASKDYFTGNYYGDPGPDGPNAIRVNADQRDGTNDSHYDANGDMPYHGRGRDGLHHYTSTANAAFSMQSTMMAVLSKWHAAGAFMAHGGANQSGIGGSYLVRDMAWHWLHHVFAWKLAADHPLGFKRKDIEDRFCVHLEAIHRDIVAPIAAGQRPANLYEYFEGLVRFGQPLVNNGSTWSCPGGGLAYYLGGVLMYMKQSGMWHAIQQRGGPASDALVFTVRCACQYAFGIFSQTKATMFSNPGFPVGTKFADGTTLPADWAEWSKVVEGDVPFAPSTDVSVYATMQFIHIMVDYFPEIDHPWKQAAHDAVVAYEKQVADRVAALAGHPDQQRAADFLYRYPGLAPLKAPVALGPGDPATLPQLQTVAAPTPAPAAAPATPADPMAGQTPPAVTGGSWKFIGREYQALTVPDNTLVACGNGTSWLQKTVSGKFDAGNTFFGSDPAYGIQKTVLQFVPDAAAVPVADPAPTTEPTPALPAAHGPGDDHVPPNTPPAADPTPQPAATPPAADTPAAPASDPTPAPTQQPASTPPGTVNVGTAIVMGMIATLQALGYTVTKP